MHIWSFNLKLIQLYKKQNIGGAKHLESPFSLFKICLKGYAPIIIRMICERLIVKLRLRCCLVAGPAKG